MPHPFISVFKNSAVLSPQKVAIKIPIIKTDRIIEGWRDITYAEFYNRLGAVAKYWLNTLKFPYGTVVGVRTSGMAYSDLLHIYSIMRAGYIPHILYSEMTNLEVLRDLIGQTGARAVIYVPGIPVEELRLPCYVAPNAEDILEEDGTLPEFDEIDIQKEDVIVNIHTSGSTSGRAKVVRMRRRWFDVNANKLDLREKASVVVPRIGSFCHAGQLFAFVLYVKEEASLILVPWINHSPEDIIQMHKECGLNVLIQYAPNLSDTIRHAQNNPELTAILQSLMVVWYTGSPLSEADVDWCRSKGLYLVTGMALTETGTLLASSDLPYFSLLQPEGCFYKMIPVDNSIVPEHIKANSPLLELIVLSNSLDVPDPSFCSPIDGHFHTKDLFEEITPGKYLYRGRLDDILIMKGSRKVDTKYIEEQVYYRCEGLISICVTVGAGKPSPALLVEPASSNIIDTKELIRQIGEKIASINEGGFPCERITPDRILLLPPGELPRSSFKANVNRVAAERKFRAEIDALYA